MAQKFCTKCGAELKEGLKFCVKCGTPIRQPIETQQTSKVVNPEYQSTINTVRKIGKAFEIILAVVPLLCCLIGFVFGIVCTNYDTGDHLLFDFYRTREPWILGHVAFFLLIITTVFYFVAILLKKRIKGLRIVLSAIGLACNLYLMIYCFVFLYDTATLVIAIMGTIGTGFFIANLFISIFRKEKQELESITKKLSLIFTAASLVVVGAAAGALTPTVFVPGYKYHQAMSLLDVNVDKAIDIFEDLNVKDSAQQALLAAARKEFQKKDYKSGIAKMQEASGHVMICYRNGNESLDSYSAYRLNVDDYSYHSYVLTKDELDEITKTDMFGKWNLVAYKFNASIYHTYDDNNHYYELPVNNLVKLYFSLPGTESLCFSLNYSDSVYKTNPYYEVKVAQDAHPISISIPSEFLNAPVTSIGYQGFFECSSLRTVNITKSIKNIEYYAFAKCTSLSTMNYEGTKAEWASVYKGYNWYDYTQLTGVNCSDGFVAFE